MNEHTTINLPKSILDCRNGIILQFQAYNNGQAQNYWVNEFVVHKTTVSKTQGLGHMFFLKGGWEGFNSIKYLYISSNKIVGNHKNDDIYTSQGLNYNNKKYVLRRVIEF